MYSEPSIVVLPLSLNAVVELASTPPPSVTPLMPTLMSPESFRLALPFDVNVGLVGGLVALEGTMLAWYFVPAIAAEADTATASPVMIMRFVNTGCPPCPLVNPWPFGPPPAGRLPTGIG